MGKPRDTELGKELEIQTVRCGVADLPCHRPAEKDGAVHLSGLSFSNVAAHHEEEKSKEAPDFPVFKVRDHTRFKLLLVPSISTGGPEADVSSF